MSNRDPYRARPSAPVAPDFYAMTPGDMMKYASDLKSRLERKQARELSYLTRRFDRGTNTPTDEAYRDDQVLEDSLLQLLEFIIQGGMVT